MDQRYQQQERRNAQRFQVSWEVAVKVTGANGSGFDETGSLRDLSSVGAFLHLSKPVTPGETLELQVKLPFRTHNWMTYSAQVVRAVETRSRVGIAVRFDSARPVFVRR
jgi:hypothetical protein